MGNKKKVHRSIRTDQFRYSLYAEGEEELYDHGNDPGEHTNEAGNPEYSSIKADLEKEMERARALSETVQP